MFTVIVPGGALWRPPLDAKKALNPACEKRAILSNVLKVR
jgi:hypothetical protein